MIFISQARKIKIWDKYPKNIKIKSNPNYGLDSKIHDYKNISTEITSNIFYIANLMKKVRGLKKIIIRNNFLIEPNIVICSNNNEYFDENITLIKKGMTKGEIIKDNIWIGLNCVNFKKNINIEDSIIAAGSVDKKYIEPNSIIGGIPINIIGI